MSRPSALRAALVLVLACRPSPPNTSPPERSTTPVTSTQEEPDTAAPADVSHGEAPIGGPAAEPAPRLARLDRAEPGRLHRVRLEMKHASIVIAPGVNYAAWTFGGTVPGPALHVRQGDTVDFTLVNGANIPHSMDFHAAEIAPSKYYTNVMPGDSLHYRFVARVPGAFLYHCGTAPVAMHIANGMYGALVVDPATPRAKATDLVLVQSEFYVGAKPDQNGNQSLDWQKLLGQAPDHIVFNGRAGQYASHPIEVRPNELIRMYLVNAGPNRISSFHVVGGIFEIRLREPGDYPFVTHAVADATKGAVGVLRALAPGAPPKATAGSR